ITEEDKQLLFTNFTQLDNSSTKSFGGTGLGLAISKQLSELLGGEIGVESQYGMGSTFWFTITCTETNDAQVKLIQQAEQTTEPGKFEKEPYVLLVDDNLINQKVAVKLLQMIGCRADVASNGFEAIEKATTQVYDVIFMDIQMPEMDGVTATQEIKKQLKENCPPIIAMTAYSMKHDAEKFISQGLDDYVSKPVKTTTLHQVISHWLQAEKKKTPPAQAPEPEAKETFLIDEQILNQLRSMGGKEFAAQLYEDFEMEAGPLLEEAKKELQAKHYNSILSKLHQIKGTGFTLGLNQLADVAKKLEHDIKAGELQEVESEFENLIHQFNLYTQTYKTITTNL
ncbi:MAG: response regulator, partial [Hymenobacteraceae bacterium]|nr:response regulator [Hymenobacteraceae bacterium]MDX5395281.1 response regulator [Hymenobacteraceae bacterium]MDX5511317.1 response regulator [Hymenobacteraceae bacterium]